MSYITRQTQTSYWLFLFSLVSVLVSVLLAITGCQMQSADIKIIESILGVDIPAYVHDAHVVQFQPDQDSTDWKYVYIKFACPQACYEDIMPRIGANIMDGSTPEVRMYLPAIWKPVLPIESWWNAKIDVPNKVAFTRQSERGLHRITIAKYENGYVFIVIHQWYDPTE